jgi:hypothetical protein
VNGRVVTADPMTELIYFATLEDLMVGRGGESVPETSLVDAFFSHGRALILAPPGAGKSTILRRLGGLGSGYESEVHSIPAVLATRGDFGVREGFSRWLMKAAQRSFGTKLLIGLDGLDEVPPADAQEVLDEIEFVTRKDPQLAIVVTDRVTRRAVRFDRWALFALALRGGEPMRDWETFPFFRADGIAAETRSDALRQLTARAVPHIEDDLPAIATKAFDWLDRVDSTAVPRHALQDMLGEAVTDRLHEANLLSDSDGVSCFRHPLYHAYFAVEHVRTRVDSWRDDTWDALTLEGANFSALGLLLEQVSDEKVDELVRAVDRWSYLASASLLAEDLTSGRRVGRGLRNALLLLLGHRRLSPSLNTSLLASDLLRLQARDDLVHRILGAHSRSELVEIAQNLADDGPWWRRWRDAFCSQDAESLVALLSDGDYLLAWTAANVLSHATPEQDVEQRLLDLVLESGSGDVRWRAVHALGSSRNAEVAERCLESFRGDGDEWVRYGALRVFLQVVARLTQAERRRLCVILAESVDAIRGSSRWEREIERAAELRGAPDDWADTFGTVVGALWTTAESLEEEDRWRTAAAMLHIEIDDPFAVALRPMPDRESR